MRIVLGDVHRMFLDALQAGLDQRGHTVVQACDDLDTIVEVVSRTRPELCLLDRDFGGRSSLGCAAVIRERHPGIKLLMLTGAATTEVWSAFDAGTVDGIINKLCGMSVLNRAIEDVRAGKRVVERFERPVARWSTSTGPASLNEREQAVVRHLVAGSSTKEMALALGVSTETVRTHVRSVLRKLGVNSRTRAAQLAVEIGAESFDSRVPTP